MAISITLVILAIVNSGCGLSTQNAQSAVSEVKYGWTMDQSPTGGLSMEYPSTYEQDLWMERISGGESQSDQNLNEAPVEQTVRGKDFASGEYPVAELIKQVPAEPEFLERFPWSRPVDRCLPDRVTVYEFYASAESCLEASAGVQSGDSPLFQTAFLDLTVNEVVEQSIRMFQSERMRPRFQKWLERSGLYLDLMSDIFRREGMPDDLVYLALIESGFNTHAYSWQRAAGPWQFIESTGRRYGLAVDWWVDERRDPVKSAEAAARYLRDLFELFSSWDLAMAAYNGGEGRIRRAVLKTRTDDFWQIRATRHIKRETKNYVPRFIAASLIARDPERYGFMDVSYHEPFSFDEVVLPEPMDIEVAARLAGTTAARIQELNPELRRWATPPYVSNYVMRVPKGTGASFLTQLAELPKDELFTMMPYRIQSGDTLASLSRNYQVPLRVIKEMNPGLHPRRLRIGQTIRIPAASTQWQNDTGISGRDKTWPYRVQKGDTLYSIARRYHVQLRNLMRANPQVHPKRLRVGDVIHIPARSA